MKVGPFEVRRNGSSYEIWEGRSLKYVMSTLDEAVDLADDLWEEDREREDRQQWGSCGIGSDEADRRWATRHEETV